MFKTFFKVAAYATTASVAAAGVVAAGYGLVELANYNTHAFLATVGGGGLTILYNLDRIFDYFALKPDKPVRQTATAVTSESAPKSNVLVMGDRAQKGKISAAKRPEDPGEEIPGGNVAYVPS